MPLKKPSGNVLTLLIVSFLFSGCGRKEFTTGEAAYEGKCVRCHKLNGKGGEKGPDLTGYFSKKDETYFRSYTVDPRSMKPDGNMPPSDLSKKELDLVIEYMKSRSGEKP